MLPESPIAAHVPRARGAIRARHRVRLPHDPRHEITDREPRVSRCLQHPAQGLVAKHQPLASGRRRTVLAPQDLRIGAADAEHQPLDQERSIADGIITVVEPR